MTDKEKIKDEVWAEHTSIYKEIGGERPYTKNIITHLTDLAIQKTAQAIFEDIGKNVLDDDLSFTTKVLIFNQLKKKWGIE